MTSVYELFAKLNQSEYQRIFDKVRQICEALEAGQSYVQLGGKPLRRTKSFVRFKIGKYRLICQSTPAGLIPRQLIKRKNLKSFLNRR